MTLGPSAPDSPPRTLPRRTLVAAGAWTVPVVAAATAAPAYAASTCQTVYDYSVNWATASYTRNASGLAGYAAVTSTQAGGDALYVHFTAVGLGTANIDTTRNLTVSNLGAGTTQDPNVTNLGNTGQSGLRLQHNARNAGIANAQELKISFRTGTSPTSPLVYVRNVGFYVTDIDGLNDTNGNRYADRVSLSPNPTLTPVVEQTRDQNTSAAVTGGGTATVSIVGTGTDSDPWKLVSGNASSTTQSYNNIAETSAGTRVRMTYENSIARSMQELTLKYWTADTATIYHRMYITNINFKARLIACG